MKKLVLLVLILTLALSLLSACGEDGADNGGNDGVNTPAETTHYKVTFKADDGSVIKSVDVEEGKQVAPPANPTKDGYSFLGWYNGDIKYDFTLAVNGDITLFAKWEKNAAEEKKVAVTYVFDDGHKETVNVIEGSAFAVKEVAVVSGYVYEWYTEDNVLLSENTVVNEALTAYAKVYTGGLTVADGVITGYSGNAVKVIIPEYFRGQKVTAIGDEAFMDADMSSVIIPEGITAIGTRAFYNCTDLESITVPDSVVTIGRGAFGFDTEVTELGSDYIAIVPIENSLAELSLPFVGGSREENGNVAYLFGAQSYTENLFSSELIEYEHNGETVNVNFVSNIPLSLAKITVRSNADIPEGAFAYCYYVTEIIFNSGVKRIGKSAFEGCISAKISGLSEVEAVDDRAFFNSSFAGPLMPGLVEIGDYAFANTVISDIILPETLKTIGSAAFAGTAVKTVRIPAGVETIGSMAFYSCDDLTDVFFDSEVPPAIDSVPFAFVDENGVAYYSNVMIWTPDNAYAAYREAVYLRDYASGIFPNSVRGKTGYIVDGDVLLGYIAEDGEGITDLLIPEGVKSLAAFSFYNCSDITDIYMPEGFESIGDYSFYNCTSVAILHMSSTLKRIGDYAFTGFFVGNNISRLYFPEGFEHIGEGAFMSSFNLRIVYLPTTLKHVGYLAFAMSNSLESMYFKSQTPPEVGEYTNDVGESFRDIFSMINAGKTTIYVPASARSTYAAADGFREFADYVKAIPSGTEVGVYGDGVLFAELDGAGGIKLSFLEFSADASTDMGGSKYYYRTVYGEYKVVGNNLLMSLDEYGAMAASFSARTITLTLEGVQHTLVEPMHYYDSYNWTNFKLFDPDNDGVGVGVFDMYGSFITPFEWSVEGTVFKISIDGNNTSPEYAGVKEYVGVYDPEADKFSVEFMLNDYEELMKFNAEINTPVYATGESARLFGKYVARAENGYAMFTLVSYGNGKVDVYIGENPYYDCDYTIDGNTVSIVIYGMKHTLTIGNDGCLTCNSGMVIPKNTFLAYEDELLDPTKLPGREDVPQE